MKRQLLLSADDRTGALEVGGLVATADRTIPVGPGADDERCAVVDIASRHLEPVQAQDRMVALLSRNAEYRAHKMDAGLRGNWAHEVEVLLEGRFKVAIVCAFPDAGRRCRDGVVYIHDHPVLESVFGDDPLNAAVSSRPADVLEHAGVHGDVVIWDANDNDEMRAAIGRARAENRVLVGASGALGAYADTVLEPGVQHQQVLPRPWCVLCGSINTLSREQIRRLDVPVQTLNPAEPLPPIRGTVVFETALPAGAIDDDAAQAMAARSADFLREAWDSIGTLFVVGGDTAGAVVGDDTLQVTGTVAPGIPVALYRGLRLVTKGGGIGTPDVFRELSMRFG